MGNEKQNCYLPVHAVGLAKIWWLEGGIGQYYLDGEWGSAGLVGKYNLKDIGDFLCKRFEAIGLDRKISKLAGSKNTYTGTIMEVKDKPEIKIIRGSEEEMELTLAGKEPSQVDIYFQGLEGIPFGKEGEAILDLYPWVQLAREIDGRRAKIITNGKLRFEDEVDLSQALSYLYMMADMEGKVNSAIKKELPEGINLGKVAYYGYLPTFYTRDAEFWSAAGDIFKSKLPDYSAIYSKIDNQELVGKLKLWERAVLRNKRLHSQNLPPKVRKQDMPILLNLEIPR